MINGAAFPPVTMATGNPIAHRNLSALPSVRQGRRTRRREKEWERVKARKRSKGRGGKWRIYSLWNSWRVRWVRVGSRKPWQHFKRNKVNNFSKADRAGMYIKRCIWKFYFKLDSKYAYVLMNSWKMHQKKTEKTPTTPQKTRCHTSLLCSCYWLGTLLNVLILSLCLCLNMLTCTADKVATE